MTEIIERAAHSQAVRDALPDTRHVFNFTEIDGIPEVDRPPDYIIFQVTRVYGGVQMNDGTTGTSLWRISTRVVAQHVDNATELLDDCRAALEGKILSIGEEYTGPIEFETEIDVAPNDGKYEALSDWTYDHV